MHLRFSSKFKIIINMKKFSMFFALLLSISIFTSCTQNELQDEVTPSTQNELQSPSAVVGENGDVAVGSRAACGFNQCTCNYKVVSVGGTANLSFCGVADGGDAVCIMNTTCPGVTNGGTKFINAPSGSFCAPTGSPVVISNLGDGSVTLKINCSQFVLPPTPNLVIPAFGQGVIRTFGNCGHINC
jgi:hypothetical protein